MYLKVKKGKDGQFYVSLRWDNHRIAMSSEGYTRKADAWRAAWNIQSGACVPEVRDADGTVPRFREEK